MCGIALKIRAAGGLGLRAAFGYNETFSSLPVSGYLVLKAELKVLSAEKKKSAESESAVGERLARFACTEKGKRRNL